ncbi:MAG: hypothetical protein WCA00_05030 [Candidatus Acidiferrales bacterium]
MTAAPIQDNNKPRAGLRAVQFIFIVWLLFVNIFYYLQFRDVFLARFAAWIHR